MSDRYRKQQAMFGSVIYDSTDESESMGAEAVVSRLNEQAAEIESLKRDLGNAEGSEEKFIYRYKQAVAERDALRAAIEAHNEAMQANCKTCFPNRICEDCPRQWGIE